MIYALLLTLTLTWTTLAHAGTLTIGPGQSAGQAIRQMQGGDTLILQGGTYREGNFSPPSGREGQPTVIKAAPGATVILAPNDRGVDTIFDLQGGKRHIVIDGVVMDGSKLTAFPFYGSSDAADITIQNTEIRNGRQSGGLLAGTGWKFLNNHIHHNGVNCCATHSDDHGLYLSADHSELRGNRFEANACYNLQVYSSTGKNPTDNVIEGNLFTGSKCGVTLSQGANHLVLNNTFVDDAVQFRDTGLLVFSPNTRVEGNAFVRMQVVVGKGGTNGAQIINNRFCEAGLTGASGQGNAQGCGQLPALDRAPGGGATVRSPAASTEALPSSTPAAPAPPSREAQMAALQAEMDAFQQRVWDEQRAEETAYQEAMLRVSQGEVATMGARLQQVFTDAVTRQQALFTQQQEGWFALLRRWQALGR